jgi:hypothetical protein
VTDDLHAQIADALPHYDWCGQLRVDYWPCSCAKRRHEAAAGLLPLFDAHGRASAATALREAADDWDANTNHVCDAPEELRDAATRLEATP